MNAILQLFYLCSSIFFEKKKHSPGTAEIASQLNILEFFIIQMLFTKPIMKSKNWWEFIDLDCFPRPTALVVYMSIHFDLFGCTIGLQFVKCVVLILKVCVKQSKLSHSNYSFFSSFPMSTHWVIYLQTKKFYKIR